MSNVRQGESERVLALVVLRAVAASLIVFLHAQELVRLYAEAHGRTFSPFKMLPLGAGVDLFFVISGFVIVYASRKLFATPGGRAEFLRRRLIRIVPLYWMALTLRLIVLAVGAAMGAKDFPGAAAIVTSYLFIPFDSLGFTAEYPFPILDLGWTLNYEMFFYLLFAIFVPLPRERAVAMVVGCLVGGVALAAIFQPDLLQLRFWLRPITWEFAFGALIALIFVRGVVLAPIMRAAMIAAGLAIWLVPISWLGDNTGPGIYGWSRLCIWGTGAVLIAAAAVLGPTSLRSTWSKVISLLGDSSYALYLLHPFVFLLVKAALAIVTFPPVLYWPVVLTACGLAIVTAALFHSIVERPLVLLLREITNRSPLRSGEKVIADEKAVPLQGASGSP